MFLTSLDLPMLISISFSALVLLVTMTKLWLLQRQSRHVTLHKNTVPGVFATAIPLAAHQKAAHYTLAKSRLALVEVLVHAATIMTWTLLGGLQWLNQTLIGLLGSGLGQEVTLVATVALVSALLDMPLDMYRIFRLESAFGFNRTTIKNWLIDTVKGMAVAAVLGLPLLTGVLALMAYAGSHWWIWAWLCFMGFNLLMMVVYPVLVAPMFNTFTPLADDALVQRIGALMQRCGFKANGFFVMDGSRRSAHGNAYFTGLGKAKRVVFFDTLLNMLNPAEVEAVLAHELGHFHHKHLLRRLLAMAASTLAGLGALAWLADQTAFYVGLGVVPNPFARNDGLVLVLATFILPFGTFFVAPVWSKLSRRDEFQADQYAASHADGAALASALLKLHKDNASTLTPDPWYVWFYYSHPPASDRLRNLPAPGASSAHLSAAVQAA